MNNLLSRKEFLSTGLLMTAGIMSIPSIVEAQQQEKPTALPSDVVNEFVKIAHTDLSKVKQMLEASPLLLNAAWDWGGGDFETAIGAAGHMGQKDIANYLLEKGARADVFVLTMLGKVEIVKQTLTAFPSLINSAGPHGFTLLHHAEKGGKDAEELVGFLQSLGLKDKHRKLFKS
jgi:ankyrin repeat protein